MPERREKFEKNLFLVGEEGGSAFGRLVPDRGWNVDAKKAVLVSGLRQAEIVAGRKFDDALEGTVVDLHDQELAFGRATAVRAEAADHETIARGGEFEIFLS